MSGLVWAGPNRAAVPHPVKALLLGGELHFREDARRVGGQGEGLQVPVPKVRCGMRYGDAGRAARSKLRMKSTHTSRQRWRLASVMTTQPLVSVTPI